MDNTVNIDLMRTFAEQDAPPSQSIAFCSEYFLQLEDEVATITPESSSIQKIKDMAGECVKCFEELTIQCNHLALDGNANFLRSALRNGASMESLTFFIARSFDAIRAPVASLDAHEQAKLQRPMRELLNAIVRIASSEQDQCEI